MAGKNQPASQWLCRVEIPSIYPAKNPGLLPSHLAWATPDMKVAIAGIAADVAAKGGRLVLSDCFRSYEMQLQAHLDYTSKKKPDYSPAPGGSMHEAGRAIDVALDDLKMTLTDFWALAKQHGVVPIITDPATKSERWHFECRGSHQLVYDHYKAGKGRNMKAGAAMAASSILALGIPVIFFADQNAAAVQAGLIRLGHDIGNIDGVIGPRTRGVLQQLGLSGDMAQIRAQLNDELQKRFPNEYFEQTSSLGETIPADSDVIAAPTPPAPAPESATLPGAQPAPQKTAEKKKPLEASRSIWGAIIAVLAGVGLFMRDFAASAWAWLETTLPFNPAWLFFGLLLMGGFLVIYARIDDRLKGRR